MYSRFDITKKFKRVNCFRKINELKMLRTAYRLSCKMDVVFNNTQQLVPSLISHTTHCVGTLTMTNI